MMPSRSKRRIPALKQAIQNCGLESLESRSLLSATLGTQIGTQSLVTGQTSTLNLTTFFNDPVVTGTAVVIATPEGNIPLVLTDSQTPLTVTNFTDYITSGEYAMTIFHRSVPGFVLQGGGYTTAGTHIPIFGKVQGEHSLSNTAGTIAMALSSGPNSGTSEYFINLADNSSALDGTADGGPFTAFGKVVYNGMSVVNAIAALPIVDDTGIANNAGTNLPVKSGTNGATVSTEPASNLVTSVPTIVPGGLTYSVVSSNPTILTAMVDASGHLTLTSPGGTGSANVTVTATDLGGGTAMTTFATNIASTPSNISPTGVTGLAATAGTPLTGVTVANFTDTNTATTPASYTATINWGDGTTSAGTITAGSTAGTFSVAGTHTYGSAGTFTTTTSITPTTGTPVTAAGSVVVAASSATSALTATGATGLAATVNVAKTLTVATFTDTNTTNPTTAYTATINWGDGTTSAGTISTNGAAGSFQVSGTHTYTTVNTDTATTTITPTTGSPATATANITVTTTVSTGPSAITAAGVTGIAASAGSAFTGTVANFTDTNVNTTVGNYTAVIAWGDGTTSAGSVSSGSTAGSFSVVGMHTYATTGTFTTTTAITPSSGPAATGTGSVIVAASTSSVSGIGATNFTVTRGLPLTAAIATFTDAKLTTTATDYTATINWGDGTTSAGTVTASGTPGGFTVTGTHTYATADVYATAVTITPSTGTGTVVAGTITAHKPVQTVVATGIGTRAIRGALATLTVASYTDTNFSDSVSISIDWGDGTTSTAVSLSHGAKGSIKVSAIHAYDTAQTYTTTTTITQANGRIITTTGTVIVRRPSVATTVTATGITGTHAIRGVASTPLLATFVDSIHSTSSSHYTALIDWGDGTTSQGTVSSNGGSGKFKVRAAHTYDTAGTYTALTTITAPGESSVSASSDIIVRRPA